MEHNRFETTEMSTADAGGISVVSDPRAFGTLSGSFVRRSAHAPAFIGAECPVCRLSSARPMFIGRTGTVHREGFLPRKDLASHRRRQPPPNRPAASSDCFSPLPLLRRLPRQKHARQVEETRKRPCRDRADPHVHSPSGRSTVPTSDSARS